MRMIELTEQQAEEVTGEYQRQFSLKPININGNYYLPESVLTIDAYSSVFDILESCPIVEVEIQTEEV